jgi:S2P endopeptidase
VYELTFCLRYLMMATLSLYLFNLLPLPLLDGSHFLKTLLHMAWGHDNGEMSDEYDLEVLGPRERQGNSRGRWWRNQVAGIISKVTLGLFGACIAFEIANTIL